MNEHRDLWWEFPTMARAQVAHLQLPGPFTSDHGGELQTIQVSYESWGELSDARDNVVLVIHPMTTDPHITGEFAEQPRGWWEDLFGPDRALDPERQFIVCPNIVGGCYGTTGPRFPAPDGEPFLDRFPLLTPRDMMQVQRLFLESLGVRRVQMVIGPSMGGMIAWEWAIEGSDLVDWVVVVAAPLRTTAHQIGLNWLQRRGIELDIEGNQVVARLGQMVARGVGMLSYRSPVGLEERFGRDWFATPGGTLKDRGMFNIESWLRHHGKRITRRFDPFSYLLYSRAMDLHDVSRNRGDLVSALERVHCKVLIVGISSDYLYPPDDVHLGADLLLHLGRQVRYEEIRSPHGHDAFLLDTDQLGTFLRSLRLGQPTRPPTRPTRQLRIVRVGILGAGRVATSFARLVQRRRPQLAEAHGLRLEIAGVAEIDPDKQLDEALSGVEVSRDPVALVQREDLDVVLDLIRGPASRELVVQALERGHHVVTPNKGLLRAHGDELVRLALQHGVRLAFHDSIAAGWPLIHALERPMARAAVSEIQAVLSSTCNVMLELMEAGSGWQEALREVVRRQLTEPDPTLDTAGWDTAQKLGILLARMTGQRHSPRDIPTTGIEAVDPELVQAAPRVGMRVKLVAQASMVEGEVRASVSPLAVPAESHLGMVRGSNHLVLLHDLEGGEMVHLGSGGADLPVATAVLNDLIGLFDPGHSWTGRYPLAPGPVPPPAPCTRFLSLREGHPLIQAQPEPDSVGILNVLRRPT